MKNLVLPALLILAGGRSLAQFKPVDSESSMQFKVKNLGFNVPGSFTGLQGDITFDPAHFENASFNVSIDAATVNTDNSLRDNHLRADGYFDVKNYPRIRMVSTKLLPGKKKDVWLFNGQLTIKKLTKDISFPFSATRVSGGWLFKGSFRRTAGFAQRRC
jgi:polyisoprenoid-binding protein YceI